MIEKRLSDFVEADVEEQIEGCGIEKLQVEERLFVLVEAGVGEIEGRGVEKPQAEEGVEEQIESCGIEKLQIEERFVLVEAGVGGHGVEKLQPQAEEDAEEKIESHAIEKPQTEEQTVQMYSIEAEASDQAQGESALDERAAMEEEEVLVRV